MTKRMLIMLGCVVVLIAALALGFFLHIKQLIANSPKPGPQTVTAAVVSALEWQPQLSSVATVSAVHGVDISSEVAGQVRKVHFKSGQDVNAGDVLVELNADSDMAQLASLQAAAELAATTLKRDQGQLAVQGVSQAQVDGDAADLKSKNALLAQQQALVAKKIIHAPFSGRLGITTTNPGQYLNPGDKIVTLQAIDPVYLDFYLPQRQVGSLSNGQVVNVQSDAYENKLFQGRVTAISPKLDLATRNIQVQATIANPKNQLLPGMFANAMVDVGEKKHYLTLPLTAITFNPYGSTVFVVKPSAAKVGETAVPQPGANLEVQQAFVTTGETRGDQVAITSGLKEGQMVVTSGQIKLKNGTPVVIDNSVQPANSPNPTPQEH
jgi:membrane fusion protein (multidrug efflux system)